MTEPAVPAAQETATEAVEEIDANAVLQSMGLPPEDDAEPEKPEAPEKEPEPEPKPEPEPEPKPAAAKVHPLEDDAVFGDEALGTPEGVLKAREVIRDAQRTNHRAFLRLEKRGTKDAASRKSLLREKADLNAQKDMLRADVQALRTGSTRTRLDTLARLSGTDAVAFLEELNIGIATDGKAEPKKEAPEIAALKNEVSELKQLLVGQQQTAEQQRLQQFVERRRGELVETAGNTAAYPRLSAIAKDNPKGVADYAVEVIQEAHQKGSPITDQEALAAIERELQRTLGAPAQPAEPARGNGQSQKETPRQAQSPPLGMQIEPAATTRGNGLREAADDDERIDVLAQQLPESFFSGLWGPAD